MPGGKYPGLSAEFSNLPAYEIESTCSVDLCMLTRDEDLAF